MQKNQQQNHTTSPMIMEVSFPKTIPEVREYFRNPFYRNSLYIALGRFSEVGFGFLFWTFAARLYSVGEVGIATALISSLGIVMAFSRLGFDIAIIRFMPEHDQSRVFSTCLWITTGAAIAVSIIYLLTIDLISPEIAFIRDYAPLFILFAVVNSITLITGRAFFSFRKADLKFAQTLIMGLRLPLLLPFVIIGGLGIFYSFGFAHLAGAVFAMVIIRSYVSLSPQIDRKFTRKTFRFSSQNYLANLLFNIPDYIMPILIVTLFSPEDAALYYIAFTIGNIVLIIPDAMSTSFLIEGSYGTNIRKGAIRNLIATYVVLIPAILSIFIFGDNLLALFGKEYLVAFNLLKIVALSSVVVTIHNLFISLQNIRLQVGTIVVINSIRFVLLLVLSYVFLSEFGVIGTGYAYMITYVIMGIGITAFAKGKGWV